MFGLTKTSFGAAPCAFRQENGGTRGASGSMQPTGLGSGLMAGTLVATAKGWRPVETILQDDRLLTFDGGLRPVRGLIRGRHCDYAHGSPNFLIPLEVPAGALGNKAPLTLLPEQCVMLESDAADLMFGDPFCLLKAGDLDGFRGITRAKPGRAYEVIQPQFDDDEVIFVNAGALVFCPNRRVIKVAELLDERLLALRYKPLSSDAARVLLDRLTQDDLASISGPQQTEVSA